MLSICVIVLTNNRKVPTLELNIYIYNNDSRCM